MVWTGEIVRNYIPEFFFLNLETYSIEWFKKSNFSLTKFLLIFNIAQYSGAKASWCWHDHSLDVLITYYFINCVNIVYLFIIAIMNIFITKLYWLTFPWEMTYNHIVHSLSASFHSHLSYFLIHQWIPSNHLSHHQVCRIAFILSRVRFRVCYTAK